MERLPKPPPATAGALPKVLVVDDEEQIRGVLRRKLSHEGFTVLTAVDGQEGLAVAFRERPDLILLDLLMPVMDGTAMLLRLREDAAWGAAVPVIVLTNVKEQAEVLKTEAGRITDYLVKADWNLSEVVDKIRWALAVRKRRAKAGEEESGRPPVAPPSP